jgi:hypothetical protein
MLRRPCLTLVALIAAAVSSSITRAQEAALPLTDDTFVNGNAPSASFGLTAEPLYVHSYGPKHTLLRFDAAALAGQSVLEATLRVYLRSLNAAGSIGVHAITTAWSERTATWATRPTFEPEALASLAVATDDVGGYVEVDITSLAQRWADGALPDAGVLLAPGTAGRALFASKEDGGQFPAILEIRSEGTVPSQTEVLDFSGDLPVVITKPGLYVLDRNWDVEGGLFEGSVLEVQADDVVIEFRGYALSVGSTLAGIVIDGRNAVLRNGRLTGHVIPVTTSTTSAGTLVDDMEIYGFEEGLSLDPGGVLRDSRFVGPGVGIFLSSDGIVEQSDIFCELACLVLRGDNNIVTNSRVAAFIDDNVHIRGNNNLVTGNVFDEHDSEDIARSFEVSGNGNSIIGNILLVGTAHSTLFEINGTENVLDQNVSVPGPEGQLARTGMVFTQDGNFYGNNRMAAVVPFELGNTTQTDWGGNVGF